MSVGLDLGSSQFRSLRRQGHLLKARACRAVYSVIQDHPARRSLFAERGVPFAEFGTNLILFGDAAEEWSTRLRVSTIPLVIHGRLQLDDRIIRQVLTALIEGLLPPPEARFDECCLTLPDGLDGTPPAAMEFLAEVVRNFGYRPSFASSSLAVALAELSLFGVSGLGVFLGETRCEFSIVRQGRELARFAIPRGLLQLTKPPMATDGQSEEFAPDSAAWLREMFATAAFELQRRPEWKALIPPVALAISGEYAGIPGLAEILPNCIQHASWPFALGAPQVSADSLWSVSRGCLIQAELDRLTQLVRPAA